MRMKKVVKEELAAMDAESDRCALELSDARVDVLGYACLVAIMAMGQGYHRVSQARLTERTASNGATAPVITSAGALVEALKVMGARKIALVAPTWSPDRAWSRTTSPPKASRWWTGVRWKSPTTSTWAATTPPNCPASWRA